MTINSKIVQCVLVFETGKNRYKLERTFVNNFSIESKITRLDSGISFFDEECVGILRKMKRPISIDAFNKNKYYKCKIFQPTNNSNRRNLRIIVDKWARSIGYNSRIFKLKGNSDWIYDVNNFNRAQSENFYEFFDPKARHDVSGYHLLINLAQLVIKKRNYGYTEPITYNLHWDSNDFELNTLMNLVNQVVQDENIQFIVLVETNQDKISDFIPGHRMPNFDIYYH